MAAAIIPIVAAAAPLLRPAISWLAVHVEHLFGAKTGPTKFDIVLNAALKIASDLATSGKIPGSLDAVSVATLVESVVQELKSSGVLNPNTAQTMVEHGNVVISQGGAASSVSATLQITGGTLVLGKAI